MNKHERQAGGIPRTEFGVVEGVWLRTARGIRSSILPMTTVSFGKEVELGSEKNQ